MMALVLTDEMKEAINTSLAQRVPLLVAANDANGQPYVSLRGSAQVHSDDQVAMWIRNVDGTTATGIKANNKVSLFYRNPETRLSFQMQGRAQLVADKALEDAIWNATPEAERNADADRKGAAMLVDIDRVIQRNQVVLSRD